MFSKIVLTTSLLLTSNFVLADLNEEYKISAGEVLANCVQDGIPIIDRVSNKNIRSYTKYDKHFISLNNNSIYVTYDKEDKALDVIFINNHHVEINTSAESAKQTLNDIKDKLLLPSLTLCLKNLHINEEALFSMVYVDPPHRKRIVKEIIKMDATGKFTLP